MMPLVYPHTQQNFTLGCTKILSNLHPVTEEYITVLYAVIQNVLSTNKVQLVTLQVTPRIFLKHQRIPVIFLKINSVPSAPLFVTLMIRLLVSPKTWLPNSTSVTSTEICGNKNEKQKCQETSVEISQLKWKELKYFIHMMSVQRVKQNDERTASPNVPFNEGVLLIEARFLKNINTTPMKGFLRPPALSSFINFF